jgi:hypothetical protein
MRGRSITKMSFSRVTLVRKIFILFGTASIFILPLVGCGFGADNRETAQDSSVISSHPRSSTPFAEAGPAAFLDCPPGSQVLESPSLEYPENTPGFDSARAAVSWFVSNFASSVLVVDPASVSVRYDDAVETQVVRSPDQNTTQHVYVPAIVDDRVQVVFGATYDPVPDGLIVNEVVSCTGVGRG